MAQESKIGLSITTLAISAFAAVAAAVVVPMFWERGTLIATAMTPVIVAVVSEALKKPVQVVSAATPKVTQRTAARRTERFEPLPAHERPSAPAPRSDDPYGLRAPRRPRRHHWWLAVATGAAAFAVAVVALTGTELVFGGPATKDGGRTTIFSGSNDRKREATPTATPSATEEATPTATEEATPPPTATPTVAPEPTATATPPTTRAPAPTTTATPPPPPAP